jgi:hypothetical protein
MDQTVIYGNLKMIFAHRQQKKLFIQADDIDAAKTS